jgi:hypothetical protein
MSCGSRAGNRWRSRALNWSAGNWSSNGFCSGSSWSSGRRRGNRRRGRGLCSTGALRSFCGGFLRYFFRSFGGFRGGFGFRQILKVLAHSFSGVNINGTGVRLFFFDAGFRQIIYDCLGLDLEVAGQFVDANLICVWHRPRESFLVWPWFGRFNCFLRSACSGLRLGGDFITCWASFGCFRCFR